MSISPDTFDSGIVVPNTLGRRLLMAVMYGILIFAAFLSLLPFYWMFMSSFKPLQDILTIPVWLIPLRPTLNNYTEVLTTTLFARSMLNSVAVGLTNVVIQTFLCSLAGFAFAKYRFRGRNLLFTLVLGTVMIPPSVQLVPNFL